MPTCISRPGLSIFHAKIECMSTSKRFGLLPVTLGGNGGDGNMQSKIGQQRGARRSLLRTHQCK